MVGLRWPCPWSLDFIAGLVNLVDHDGTIGGLLSVISYR